MNSNTLLEKLDKVLSPIGAKVGNQIHLKSISNGMMMTLPLIVVGSIFLIIANPPVNPDLINPETANIFMKFMLSWKEFAVNNYQTLTTPYNMTMGIVGMMSAFAIAYCLAGEYNMKAAISGLISTSMFLMICAPSVDGSIATNFLGADGLFIAIIIGLSSVEITRFVESRGWQFKFPDTVPPAVTAFVNSLLPLLLNIIVLYGINILIMSNIGVGIPEAIMKVLTPALSVVDNIWGYLAIITFGNVLWLLGVNGTSIIFPIVFALGIQNTGINADLVANGQDPSVVMNLQMFRLAILGGAGNTLGLTLLMMKSKSTHLKSLGRLGVVPGICGINEPIIFGGPIVFNPIPGYLVDPSFIPFFAQAYFSSMDWRNVLFVFGLVILSVIIYYPFFKVYEKNMLEQEYPDDNSVA